ncbi:MAG: serine hydrolase [Steroidobacteraceae bacterium]
MKHPAVRRAGLLTLSWTLALASALASAREAPVDTLDRAFLFGAAQPSAPLPMHAFTPPVAAAAPLHAFEGRLTLSREALIGSLRVHKDDYGTAKTAPDLLRHLPEFDFEFVSSGDALIPVRRGSIESSHPQWEYVLEPGRIWSDPRDGGLTRAALPFSLEERNANCLHNGVMTFLFDASGAVSRVAYQVSSETCAYLKLDLWGVLPARYRPAKIARGGEVRAAYAREVAARLPTRPIETLAAAYPGANPAAFGNPDEVPREDMTAYGFVIDGVHYVGGCDTRAGPYPFCDVLDLPSYSLAKSLVAGLGSLALAREFPGVLDARIADYVPACKAAGGWDDVRFRDALDMATGHFDSPRYDEDEKSPATLPFFIAENHQAKIEFACRHFPRRAGPGTQWVYHTTDTYVLGTALEAYVQRHLGAGHDFYRDVVVAKLWAPLGLSPVTRETRRTRDLAAQPFTGWGLTLHRDDIARIGQWLVAPQGPRINDVSPFDEKQLRIALQRDPQDRGLRAIDDSFRYARGFWAHEVSRYIGCAQPVWVPYMAGFGGINVLLLPNGTVYYYFSDGEAFRWAGAAVESNRIRSFCKGEAP